MKKISYAYQAGIGTIAVVAIIGAVIAAGAIIYTLSAGTDTEVYTRSGTDSENEANADQSAEVAAKLRSIREDALEILAGLRAQIQATSSAQVSSDVFAQVKADITDVYARADAKTKAELNRLRAQIAQAEARLAAEGADAREKAEEAFSSISADIRASLGAGIGATTTGTSSVGTSTR